MRWSFKRYPLQLLYSLSGRFAASATQTHIRVSPPVFFTLRSLNPPCITFTSFVMLLSIHPSPHVVHFNVSSFPSNNLHHVNFSLWSAFFLCPSSVIFSSFVSLFPDSELLCISSILRFSYLLPCFSLLLLLCTLARAVDHRVYLLPRAHFAARTVRRANVIQERQLRANGTAYRWTSYDFPPLIS